MADDSGKNRPNRPFRPRQGAPGARRKRRGVIHTRAGRRGREGRQARDRSTREPRAEQQVVQPTGPVSVESGVSVRDLSQALGVGMQEIIKILMGLGVMKMATQSLTDDEVELIAAELKRE